MRKEREPLTLDDFGDIMTLEDVQQYLKIGTTKLYQEINEGNIRTFKIGHSRRFLKKDVKEYVERMVGLCSK